MCKSNNILSIVNYILHKELDYYIPEDFYVYWEKFVAFQKCSCMASLLTTLLPDNKNCVRILKGSYIVMKCSDNKVYETIWYLPSESARSTADKWLTLVLWHHYNVSH